MDSSARVRFLRLPEVEQRTGLRHTQIHKLEVDGRFPRRIKIAVRAAGWLEHEINAWIEGRVTESRTGGSNRESKQAGEFRASIHSPAQ